MLGIIVEGNFTPQMLLETSRNYEKACSTCCNCVGAKYLMTLVFGIEVAPG